MCQGKFITGILLGADLRRPGGDEPGLCEHPLRGDVLVAGRSSERPQPILLARDPAEFLQRGGRDAATGDPLSNAITDLRSPIDEVVQVEATHDLLVVDEHVKDAGTGFLLGQQRAMSLSELLKEIVATIADGLGEEGPIGLLKSEDRWCVISSEALQFQHPSNLACVAVSTTMSSSFKQTGRLRHFLAARGGRTRAKSPA